MEEQKNYALSMFRKGYNCAQAVLTAFAANYNLNETEAIAITNGFGAGMGRLQYTCGAVTGAYMIFGIHNQKVFLEKSDIKEATYKMVQEFHKHFSAKFGSTQCADLLQCNLLTDQGQKQFYERGLSEKVCEQCIVYAVELVYKLTNSK